MLKPIVLAALASTVATAVFNQTDPLPEWQASGKRRKRK